MAVPMAVVMVSTLLDGAVMAAPASVTPAAAFSLGAPRLAMAAAIVFSGTELIVTIVANPAT